MKPVSSKLIFAEVASEVGFRCIHTLFNAAYRDMECFNQLQMHHCFDILNIKHWILILKIILKTKIDFKCEIKISSRWQKVTGNKWVIVTEPNHLNDWIIQERITLMLLRDAKQRCGCL